MEVSAEMTVSETSSRFAWSGSLYGKKEVSADVKVSETSSFCIVVGTARFDSIGSQLSPRPACCKRKNKNA